MESQSRISMVWQRSVSFTAAAVAGLFIAATSLLWFSSWFLIAEASDSNWHPICGGVHGLDAHSGRLHLLAVGFGVVAPLITAGLLAARRQWVTAAIWLVLGLVSLGIMVNLGVATPAGLRHAVDVTTNPPPWEPGTIPDRLGICDRANA